LGPGVRTLAVRAFAGLAAWSLLAGAASAQDLLGAWNKAVLHDARFQSAQAQYHASQARAGQARAGLLPQIGLGASSTRSKLDTTLDTPAGQQNPVSHYSTHNIGINASQPLYRPANLATARQGDKQSELAQHELDRAGQQLITRLAQAYFDVLAAQDQLTTTRQLEKAVGQQKAAADNNFELGNTTITDSREAQARADQVAAQRIAAENRLQVARLALDTVIGEPGFVPLPLAQPVRLPDVAARGMDDWVAIALAQHPALAQARLAVQVAELETEKAKAGHKPTVDLVASVGRVNYPQGNPQGMYPGMPMRANQASIGLQLNMPLFAGFAVQNRVRETLSLEDKARADMQDAERQITQAVRSAWLNLQAGRSQIQALEAAEASARTALEANQLGYEVGVRINIDVLNAQTQLYDVRRQLAQARYELIVGWLRLHEAAGVLTDDELRPVNAMLASAPAAPVVDEPAGDARPASAGDARARIAPPARRAASTPR
jgi:outer membrane protein